MRRENQIWLTGAIVAVIGFGSIVVINQRGQIGQQQRAMDQQALQAKALQERSDEADQLRKQESIFTLQLRALDAEQANQAVSAQRSLERQQLIGQIQDLRTQRVQMVGQANCTRPKWVSRLLNAQEIRFRLRPCRIVGMPTAPVNQNLRVA